jgi:hypothetical protein
MSETPLALDKIDSGSDGLRDCWLELLAAWEAILFEYEPIDTGEVLTLISQPATPRPMATAR